MSLEIIEAKADEIRMEYFCFGEGEKNLVILPGLSIQSVMLSADAVAGAYEEFAQDYKVWVMDVRSNLPEEYSIREMAEDTAKILASLGISKTVLFGVSMGGMVSQYLTLNHPELVEKLVLASTAPSLENASGEAFEKWLSSAENNQVSELLKSFCELVYSPETAAKLAGILPAMAKVVTGEDLKRIITLVKAVREFDVLSKIPEINCPVFVLGSEKDRVLEVACMKKFEVIPNVEMYFYPDFSHAVYDEAPDFKERIINFLEK